MEDTKECSRCKEKKYASEFNKSKEGKLGLHSNCRICQKIYKREWYEKNRQHCLDYGKRKDVKESVRKRASLKYSSNKEWREEHLRKNRERRRLEPAKIKQRINEKSRRKRNSNYRIGQNLRSRLRVALIQQGVKNKSAKTFDLIGCSPSFLKEYLESLWLDGMTWENYGPQGWHIDHIKPCCSFNLELAEEQEKCFHYTNLQPLWADDNISKGGKILV